MKRKIRSFEADSDVDAMLTAAQKDGVKISNVLNAVLRKHGRRTVFEILDAAGKASKKYKGNQQN